MNRTLRIAPRFNGPVASGNGGYSAGLAANLLGDGAAEATLRAAIPLNQTLRAHDADNGLDIMTDDAATRILVMSLKPVELFPPDVESPGLEAARVASQTFRTAEDHVLPTCFVCGPARAPGDGLRIFTDWLQDPAGVDNPNSFPIVAAPWTPTPDLLGADGRVAPEFLWAALDCPGAFAVDKQPILLGRMAAKIVERPRAGRPIVAIAWAKGHERRKHFAGTALFSDTGDLLAFSDQTWIQIDAHAHTRPN
jgi:hypothetical protein